LTNLKEYCHIVGRICAGCCDGLQEKKAGMGKRERGKRENVYFSASVRKLWLITSQ